MATLQKARSTLLQAFSSAQPMARVLFAKQRNWRATQHLRKHLRKPFSSSMTPQTWATRNPRAQQQTFSYSSQYRPPPRQPFGNSSSTLIVGSVIAGCLGLYGYEQRQEREMKNGSREAYAAVQNMKKHFVLSLDNIREGRYYVMLTSSFAHANGPHLLFNMMGLWGFGTTMVQIFGVKHFALIWMGSALVGSVLQLGYWQKTERQGIKHEAVGASGALFGIMSALSVIFPRLPVALIIIPMSLRTCMALSVALSLGAINQGWLPSLGHVDHLGGMAFGFLYALVALRRGRVRSPF